MSMGTQVRSCLWGPEEVLDPLKLGESHSMDAGKQTDLQGQKYMLFRAKTSALDGWSLELIVLLLPLC